MLDPAPPQDRFQATLAAAGVDLPQRATVTTLQVNIGLRCNLACHHCHVESGPKRKEAMGRRELNRILELLALNPDVEVLDVTGGAPELHEGFRTLVRGARRLGRRVIDRCNLTVLFEPGQEGTAAFLAENGVEIVASLPCYTPENVESQRGRGVFATSILALQRLNELGYGRPGGSLRLDLVYNPGGPFLPPDAAELETRYRSELGERFGIEFQRLITITNMPIKRFARELARSGQEEAYLELLTRSFNPSTVDLLMCRSTLSVDHRGILHDCDFNLALGIGLLSSDEGSREGPSEGARSIFDLDDLGSLAGNAIATGHHCLGCTAGSGSSCGGALVQAAESGGS